MENIVHIHEVLDFLMQEDKGFTRDQLTAKMTELFGEDVRFTTCGDHILNPEEAIDFMYQRNKIAVSDGQIKINSQIEKCSH
jgi:probable metal-binding protein